MWVSVGTNRWDWTADEDRHLLMYDGIGAFSELHMGWVHWYRAAETGPGADPWPLTGAWPYRTVELAAGDPPSDEAGWQVLSDALKEA